MTEQRIKRRYGSLAAVVSLFSPGLGHLYAGKWQLALLIPFVLMLLPATLGWSGLIFMPVGMVLLAIGLVVFYLVVISSAFVAARKSSNTPANDGQRWYLYVAFIIVTVMFNLVLTEYRGKLFAYDTYRIPADSMLPTLMSGDLIVVDTYAYKNKPAERGELLVFNYPRDPKIQYIKRVIGVAGDHVAYSDKILYINDKPVMRHEIGLQSTAEDAPSVTYYSETLGNNIYSIMHLSERPAINAAYVIPDGQYFVMGDNRDNSNDSRYWGVVSNDKLRGKAIYIWMSFDKALNIRHERIGLKL